VLRDLPIRRSAVHMPAGLPDQPPLVILYHHRTQAQDGQFVHVQELISALRTLGHQVVVVAPRNSDSVKFGDDSRIGQAAKRYIPTPIYELLELAYSIPEFFALLRAYWRVRPDAFYQRANIFMLSGVMLAGIFRVPYLLEVNSPLAEERDRFGRLSLPGLASWTEHVMWRSADRVLSVTGVLARKIAAAGVPSDRIVVIPNGVDLEKFAAKSRPFERDWLGLDGKLVLGLTGFIREWHRADAIVDLLAEGILPDNSHFLIVGDGPVRDDLIAQARRLGVGERLTITGTVPRERVADYVRRFDIALQPDVVDYACPLKLIEYMALGRAIVAPDRENIRELVSHEESALLVPPRDAAGLGATLARLAHDAPLRQRLGESAQRTIVSRNLTWLHNARRVEELSRQLAAGVTRG
jgi:glycosyltransferase involved in cell wall biosynthesis